MKELTLQEAALAWAQGKRVEATCKTSGISGLVSELGTRNATWSCNLFGRECGTFSFRLAPKPPAKRFRPWTPEEIPIGALIRSKKHQWRSLVLGALSTGYIQIHDGGFAPDFALENHEHSTDGGKTWAPCGVEVES